MTFSKKSILLGLFFSGVIFLIMTSSALSASYYISSSEGNDANLGTSPENPWKTLSKVQNSKFQPGDKINLKKGDFWRETLILPSSGIESNNIVITSYGTGEKPLFRGCTEVETWYEVAPGIYGYDYPYTFKGFYEDGKVLSRASSSKLLDGDWFHNGVTIFYRPTNGVPSDHVVERAARPTGIHIQEKHHITLDDLAFYGHNGYGVRLIDSYDIEVKNCIMTKNTNFGISLERRTLEIPAQGVSIKNNTIEWNGNGIYLYGKDVGAGPGWNNCEIIDNTITYTNFENTWSHTTPDGHAIGIQNSSNLVVEGNTLLHNWNGITLWVAASQYATGNTFARNYISDSQQYGVVSGSDASDNAGSNTWAYNIIVNNGHWPGNWGGLRVNGVHHESNHCLHNTLYNNDINIYLNSVPGYWIIRNNISLNPLRYHVVVRTIRENNIIDNNVYFSSSENAFSYESSTELSFEKWKEISNQDKESLFLDPLLLSAEPEAAEEFQPKIGSPCIDKAHIGTIHMATDFLGNKIDDAPDIGAIEYIQKDLDLPEPPSGLRFMD